MNYGNKRDKTTAINITGIAALQPETRQKQHANIDYVECLKNKLPCDCEEITHTYFSIALDTVIYSKHYGVALSKFEQMEPFIYPI